MVDEISIPLAALFVFLAAGGYIFQGRFSDMLLALAVLWLVMAVIPGPPKD